MRLTKRTVVMAVVGTSVFVAWITVTSVVIMVALLAGGLEITGPWVCPDNTEVEVKMNREGMVGGRQGISPEVYCVDEDDRTDETFAAMSLLLGGVGAVPTLLALGVVVVAWRNADKA